MKDSFHKKLTEHIRKTVGQHEVPYEPGSWEEFQRLQQRRRQRQPVVWLRYAMAACLLLGLLGVPLWLYVGPSQPTKLALRPVGPKPKPDVAHPSVAQPPSIRPVEEKAVTANRSATPSSVPQNQELPQNRIAWENALPAHQQVRTTRTDVRNKPMLNRLRAKSAPEPNPLIVSEPSASFSNERAANLPAATDESATPLGSFARIKPRSRPGYRWSLRPLGLPLNVQVEGAQVTVTNPSKTGPVWGVSLAPQSVHAAGSSPAVALGGGLFSELPISRRFSLSTGLSMARQTLGTTESGPIIALSSPHLVSTDIRLTTIDVPINLRFRPKGSSEMGFYIEAGFSSLAFLNERYAETYEQQKEVVVLVMGTNGQEQTVTQYVTEQQIVNHSEPAFGRIYWGRLLNFSIGVERRMDSRFRLSAEPYLKYPIGPFTRENLMLGSGGISLRLGFQAGR